MADYQYKPSPQARTVRLFEGLLKADCKWVGWTLTFCAIDLTEAPIASSQDDTLSTFEFAPLDEEYHEPLTMGHPIGLDESSVVQERHGQNMAWDGDITRRSRLHALPPPQFSTQSIPARFA
jgi:hypothetical protein